MLAGVSHYFEALAMCADDLLYCLIPDIDVKGQISKSGMAETSDVDKDLADPAVWGLHESERPQNVQNTKMCCVDRLPFV
jgi:hypothetical protein